MSTTMSADRRRRRRKSLMDESLSISLITSILIILCVQMCSLFLVIYLTRKDANHEARVTADEIAIILKEPLYNVETAQVVRIAEVLISSGRISGIRIEAEGFGIVYERKANAHSRWIEPQARRIEFRNIRLGNVSIEYNESRFVEMIEIFSFITAALIVTVLLSNIFVILFILRKRVRRVFAAVEKGIQEIRAGNYDYSIDDSGYRDMDVIIDLLNDMSRNIHEKSSELLELNARLEARVAERTSDLEAALAEQSLLQERLVESGKLSILGQLSAGIAHEFNTPLGAIISANNNLLGYFDGSLKDQPAFFTGLNETGRELYLRVFEIGFAENRTPNLPLYDRKAKRDAAEILQKAGIDEAERIADILGDMYLLGRIDELVPYLRTEGAPEILTAVCGSVVARRMAEIIGESGKKASAVVAALRSYLSPETMENRIVDVNEELKRVLTLMHNLLKHGIEIRSELSPEPVLCVADGIDQVLLNIIRNAAQAMDFRGTLTFRTGTGNGRIWISVEDTGPGIPESIRNRIFEPFFTTRKHGAGMGLGLDICRRIVEKFKGTLDFTSRPGKTEFVVTLPAHDEKT